VLISREDNRTKKSGYTLYRWSGDTEGSGDIGTLLTNIPDEIEFEIDAHAKDGEEVTIELGKEYTLKPKYFIEAPLALRSGSQPALGSIRIASPVSPPSTKPFTPKELKTNCWSSIGRM
jgi:hypothetical protein